LATTAGAFVSNVIIARVLGLEGMGIVAFATWLVMMGATAIDIGASAGLARYIPELRSHQRSEEISALTLFLLRRMAFAAFAVCSGFSLYGFWRWNSAGSADFWTLRGDFESEPLFYVLVAIGCATQALTGLVVGYLQGSQNFGQMARIALWSAALRLVASATLANWLGIAGAMLAPVAGSMVTIALLPTLMSRPQSPAPAEFKKRVGRFMWESWASYVLTAFVAARMEIAFLQLNWGSAGVSVYAVGLTFANLATTGTLLLSGALLPYLSQLSRNDHALAYKAYSDAMRMIAFLVFPACLGAAAILPRLLPMLYGAEFEKAVPAGVLLLCAGTANALTTVSFVFLMAMERTRFLFMTGVVGTVLMIAAGLLVVPKFGPEGAAISRGLVMAVIASANVWYINHRLHCPTPLAALGRLLAAAILCALAARLALNLVPGAASLALAITIGMVVFAFAVRLLGALESDDAKQLKSVATLLPEPLHPLVQAAIQMLCVR
jgi:O-antigen/teichoic acid export membrane protein